MKNFRINDYENGMQESIYSLFLKIYPGNTILAKKMCYNKEMPNHVTTKVAFQGQSIIGQANIFQKQELEGNANLGFHVHPGKRLLGVAKSLSLQAIEDAKEKGIERIYIITKQENDAAKAVAMSIGFSKDKLLNIDKDMVAFSNSL